MKKQTSKQILNQRNALLWDIVAKAKHLEKLNQIFLKYIDVSMISYCRVANLKQSVLLIEVDSGAWLTQLRYQASQILQGIRKEKVFAHISQLKFYVNPKKEQKKKLKPPRNNAISSQPLDDKDFAGIKDNNLKHSMAKLQRSYQNKKLS